MDEDIEILNTLYTKLKDVCVRSQQKKIHGSIYLALFDIGSKTRRMRVLIDSAVPPSVLTFSDLERFIGLNYIQYIDEDKNLVLTSKGIWEIEKNLNIIDEDKLIDFINGKAFDCFKSINQSLQDKEKVLLLVAMSVRTFSESSSVDLTKSERIHSYWKDAVEKSYEFLCENKVILNKDVLKDLFNGRTGKTALLPVIHCFRYSADIPKKTNGIYIAKNSKYYLNIYQNGDVEVNKLAFLFNLIFKENINSELVKNIYEHCCTMSYEKSVEVFSVGEHPFATSTYDELIYEALRMLIVDVRP
ncbi:MAG: hypothetical protein CVU71_16935 [Deltaproteobacteria bacterium HGW-Deltaproteobacteria-6]|jgi:hypothetical protein|nr:MAG: hypothetical protein CVU71_16935 [Deltaproteobacteria bacterium HGW-Deltaproteobacteria-6]